MRYIKMNKFAIVLWKHGEKYEEIKVAEYWFLKPDRTIDYSFYHEFVPALIEDWVILGTPEEIILEDYAEYFKSPYEET